MFDQVGNYAAFLDPECDHPDTIPEADGGNVVRNTTIIAHDGKVHEYTAAAGIVCECHDRLVDSITIQVAARCGIGHEGNDRP